MASISQESNREFDQELLSLEEKRNKVLKELSAIDDQIAEIEKKLDTPTEGARQEPELGPKKSKQSPGLDQLLEDFAETYSVRVRRSVIDSKQVGLPALFQYARDGSGADSASVDIGFAMEGDWEALDPLLDGAAWTLTAERHYNSNPTNIQDTSYVGGGVQWNVGSLDFGGYLSLDGGFKRDETVAGEGGVGSLLFFPEILDLGFGFNQGNTYVAPFMGFDFESGNGASATFRQGQRSSFRTGLNATTTVLSDRLELGANLGYWSHIDTSGLYNSYDTNQLFVVGSATYWLSTDLNGNGVLEDSEKHFGLTTEYKNGDNPIEGALDIDLWTIGFSIFY